ncbi:hypothetical protein B0H21DRAFT_736146 [Amylocystis lapponica]|nr:hypothetical protein B0H21DRAFT_736146 [Amylocystis lapponica]
MPKASTTSSNSPASSSSKAPFQSAHILRRNQACHQCRKRKLKCDAKRPCSTCVRSHTYAVAHAPAGTELSPNPECTFDESAEADNQEPYEQPRSRFERLESRINELEALLIEKNKALRDKELMSPHLTTKAHPTSSGDPHMITMMNNVFSVQSNGSVQLDQFNPELSGIDFPHYPHKNSMDDSVGVAHSMETSLSAPSQASHLGSNTSSPDDNPSTSNALTLSSSPGSFEVLSQSWPKTLPSPGLVRHLIDAFFTFHAHANIIFHTPTFMASLSLPPSHPKFPNVALLHAICAVGSMYTGAVEHVPPPVAPDFEPHDPFPDKWRGERPDSFAEVHVKYARTAIEGAVYMGENLFQLIQAKIILCWWYWAHAKWSEAHLSAAQSLRLVVPCGLNVCPPFHTIASCLRAPSLLPPAKTVAEDELRRNVFWLAYAIERTHGCGNSWAMMLDDQDISQLLPVRSDQFEQGVLVLPDERQWSHDKDVLLRHPEDQTDPFILYIKSTILLSRVKNFNLRFRSKYHAGDPATLSPSTNAVEDAEFFDVRKTPAFIEIDELVAAFLASFPLHLKHPVRGHLVHSHLFTACIASHLANILLHETHAVVGRSTCTSSRKILVAARAILDQLYQVSATSYEISLLGLFSLMGFFMAGRVLVRFLHVAIDYKSEEQTAILRAEVDFIRTTLAKSGEHVPLAHRYSKMLQDFVLQLCGEEYAVVTGLTALPPRDGLEPSRDGVVYGAPYTIGPGGEYETYSTSLAV